MFDPHSSSRRPKSAAACTVVKKSDRPKTVLYHVSEQQANVVLQPPPKRNSIVTSENATNIFPDIEAVNGLSNNPKTVVANTRNEGSAKRQRKSTKLHRKKLQHHHHNRTQNAYSRNIDLVTYPNICPTKETTRGQDIEMDTLRPLIDLAYWSPFVEVRRDAAAAFATLSKNPANHVVLSHAGTLGAVLALISWKCKKPDLPVLRDSATALYELLNVPDIQAKLLNAPGGLEAIFFLSRISDKQIKRLAVNCLETISENVKAKQVIVDVGGTKYLLQMLRNRDSYIQKHSAIILKKMAESEHARQRISEYPVLPMFKQIIENQKIDKSASFAMEILHILLLLSTVKKNPIKMAEENFLPFLLNMISTKYPNYQLACLSLQLLESIAKVPETIEYFIKESTLQIVVQYCSMNAANVLEKYMHHYKSTRREHYSPHKNLKTPNEENIFRLTLGIILELSKHNSSESHVICSGALELLSKYEVLFLKERKVRRCVAQIVSRLCGRNTSNPDAADTCVVDKHMELVSRGVFHIISSLLKTTDIETRFEALNAVLSLSDTANICSVLCKDVVVDTLIEFAFHPTEQIGEKISKIIANFAESDLTQNQSKAKNCTLLINSGIFIVILKFIAPSYSNEVVRYYSMRAVAAMSSIDSLKNQLVDSGILSFLMRSAKENTIKIAEYANKAVKNLKFDAAALQIQSALRGWLCRKQHKLTWGDKSNSDLNVIRALSAKAGRNYIAENVNSIDSIRSRFFTSKLL